MPPWTRRLIASQLERITVKNYAEVADKIVALLDSRSTVQHLAAMVVRQANRWYAASFHDALDGHKRNLCDNFVGSLLHALAVRVKPIKDVPTPEGLSGIPLFKADLLSVWIYRRMSIGPIAAALYNSRNLTVGDLRVVVRACMETAYTAKEGNIADALLLLELGGRDLNAKEPAELSTFVRDLKALLDRKRAKASQRVKIGDRMVPSLMDRYQALMANYQQGWRLSPYGTASPAARASRPVVLATDTDSVAPDETRSNADETESSASPPPLTPVLPTERPHDNYEAILAQSGDADLDNGEATTTVDSIWTVGKASFKAMPISPWNAYFAEVMADGERGNGRRNRPASLDLPESDRISKEVELIVDSPPATAGRPERRDSVASTSASIGQESTYASRAQMEIMQRPFPAELMRRQQLLQGSADVLARKGSERSVRPSASEALGLHIARPVHGFETGEQLTERRKSTSAARRRVNSEAGLNGKGPGTPSHRHFDYTAHHYGPRRASEAHAVTPSACVPPPPVLPGDETATAKAFPATFHGDAIWIQLDRPRPYGVHIRFPSDFRVGDAQRIARHLSEALQLSSSTVRYDGEDGYDSLLHFTPSGAVVQDLTFGDKHVFVEFCPDMTLAQARSVGQTLHEAATQLAV